MSSFLKDLKLDAEVVAKKYKAYFWVTNEGVFMGNNCEKLNFFNGVFNGIGKL